MVKNRFPSLAETSLVGFHRFEKALILSAFFIVSFLISTDASAQSNNQHCAKFVAGESAVISHIHDGDTLFLQDKRKLRLIGIDTPELQSRDKKNNIIRPAQPFAIAARNFARDLIRQYGNHVKLMAGNEPVDHYGRQLFHIQLSDGSLLQSRLLQAGLAVAYTTPPNHKLSLCYQSNEQQAREQQLNIWLEKNYQTIAVSQITKNSRGFHRIRGKVRHIGESKKAFWINFYGNFSARIDKRDLHYFKSSLPLLLNKEITLRGWLHRYNNKPQLSLRHPSSIEIH